MSRAKTDAARTERRELADRALRGLQGARAIAELAGAAPPRQEGLRDDTLVTAMTTVTAMLDQVEKDIEKLGYASE